MAKTDAKSKTKKKKSSKKSGPNAVAMKLKAPPKENPFETIWSRRKFDVLGKKRKGEERRVGQARTLSIEKRNKTLLKEYERSGKASVFLDKRIGEDDDTLGEFDKAILRRQRKIKKTSKFNLSDEEDDFREVDFGVDHFDEEVEHGSDEDDDFSQDRSAMKRLRTLHGQESAEAGFAEDEEDRPKSKKEVMEEVIMKSKLFKAEKARGKEENEKLIEQLDKEFESLVQSQALSSLTQPDKINALKALVNPNFSKENKKKGVSVLANSKQDEPDSYDKLVNEMMMEIRARPSDRTKTPEEIAEEEKERLEQLEEERQNRMLANDDASDEDDDSEDGGDQPAKINSHISGDDLGDSFTNDEKPKNKKGWVDEILERNDAEDTENEDSESSDDSGDEDDDDGGSEEDEENDGKAETLKDWEQSDDDVSGEYEVDEESDKEKGEDDTHPQSRDKDSKLAPNSERGGKKNTTTSDSDKAKGAVKQASSVKRDLPFKIEAPSTKEELMTLFEGRSNEDITEAIRRIRVCNAISLAAENRKKTQVFYGLLLQYFATLANQKPLNFLLVNMLVKPLMEMSAQIPYFSAICARSRIFRTWTKLSEDIKDTEKSCWPSLKTMFLLRLWSMIFPCSDFRHAVMTPAMLLMCKYLMHCPVLSGRDAAIGSFLCSMVLLVTKQSQKYCPEVLIFLKAMLLAAMDKDSGSSQHTQFHQLELKAPKHLLCVREEMQEIKPLDFLKIMNLTEDSSSFNTDDFRASVLVSVVETLKGFVNMYGDLKAFPEIFLPISTLSTEVADQPNMPKPLQEKLREVAELITKKAEEHHKLRQPLQMRKQKPVPIKLLTPKFEENFVKGRDYDPDRERAEIKKFNKLYKREAKGAARELRKDNYFLSAVKEKEKLRQEQERAENYGKVRAFLQEQEHAYKSGQLGKGGRKRRR